MKKRLLICALCVAMTLTLAAPAFAASQAEIDAATVILKEKGIMVGSGGDMMLEQNLTRAQLAAVLTRMTVNMEHVEAERDFYARQCRFTDVPDWAKVYVGYCATNHIVSGYGDGRYGSGDPVTPAAACTVLLRCLEDIDADWTYHTACEKAVSVGIADADMLRGSEISRGNIAVMLCRTMERIGGYDVELPKESETRAALSYNADGSINVPSDGSRYIPKAGDVIRCDDGSNYTITDVRRYDANMFASGPLPELPNPTCDWSLLPQPELPPAETRRYTDVGDDTLFIRNLYETRRMLYTLYNAIGDNPETWQDGKPVLHPSGDPKVKIKLTIDKGQEAEFFWPWRDREIVAPFNSCPCGTHSLEAWDIYTNGIFQYTMYNVYFDF